MKKLLFILAVATFISCSNDESPCKCQAEYLIFGTGSTFSVPNTELDCNTNQPITTPQQNAVFIGCK